MSRNGHKGAAKGKDKTKVLSGTDGADNLKGGRDDDRIFGFGGKNKSSDVGTIEVERVGSGFEGAVYASAAPGEPDHLYVLRKDVGEIHILDPATGQSSLFLDIPDRVHQGRRTGRARPRLPSRLRWERPVFRSSREPGGERRDP